MPSVPPADLLLATRDDVRQLRADIAELRAVIDAVVKDQQVQFTRIAQLQADIDVIRAAWAKLKAPEQKQPYVGPERRTAPRKVR